ncbi:hypothetical protein EMCRGX_G022702 [Ephydatia muelleri]|eukprot:Em0017g924a
MAGEIASLVVGSQLKKITKGVEGAVGLDDKEPSNAQLEHDREKQARKDKRAAEEKKRDKEELHKEKELERKNIREKYKLPKTDPKAKTSPGRATGSHGDGEKCCIS